MDRVAIVTGAGSGLGREITRALAADGHTVVLVGRRQAALEEVAADLGGPVLVQAADVSEERDVARLFARVVHELGRLDLLVNNAGIFGETAPLDELPLAEWRAVLNTNLTGAYLCTREAVRVMRAQRPQGGRIINNGSVAVSVPRPHAIAYTASKHGLLGLTRTTALEGRGDGIACGQIDIGNAATSLTSGIALGALQPDGSRRPEPTFDAEIVGRAVAFMASLPLEANVLQMTIAATGMPLVGRG